MTTPGLEMDSTSSLGVRKDGKPLEGRGRKALAETLLGGKVSWTQLNTRCNEQRNSSGLRQEWCLKRFFLMHWSSFDKGILYLEFQHVLGFREPQRNIHLLSNKQIKFLSKRLHDSHPSGCLQLLPLSEIHVTFQREMCSAERWYVFGDQRF